MLQAANSSMKQPLKLRTVFLVVLWISGSFNMLLQLLHLRRPDLQNHDDKQLRRVRLPAIVVDEGNGSNSGVVKTYPSPQQSFSSVVEQLDFIDTPGANINNEMNDASLDDSAKGSESDHADVEVNNFLSPYSMYKKNETHVPRFAYAYVISGCNEAGAHRNYLYDIAISTYTQRESGSTADVIVFIQMSYQSSLDELVQRDRRLLDVLNIIVMYIPKTAEESFYRTMLDKFQILGLVQYERVLYMDGDVMARGSLDYLFDLSVQGVLNRNIVIVGLSEPASGGFFMISPSDNALNRILAIIRDKEERGKKLPFPHWDEKIGWGHKFEEGDFARLRSGRQCKKWDFYGAFADQGLLYHWVKYEEKSVSILYKDSVENWKVDVNGTLVEQRLQSRLFKKYNSDRVCWNKRHCKAPFNDFVHFTGKSKPWLRPPPIGFETNATLSPQHYWYNTLFSLNSKMALGIDFTSWSLQRPLHGLYPTHNSASKTSYSSSHGQDDNGSVGTK